MSNAINVIRLQTKLYFFFQETFDSFSHRLNVKIKYPPFSIDVNGIYLVKDANAWHRVRVSDVSNNNNECECFFIDQGHRKRKENRELFFCPEEFLTLPPQAVCFSMCELENYAEHPYAAEALRAYFCGRVNRRILVRAFHTIDDCADTTMLAEFLEMGDGNIIQCADAVLTKIAELTPKPLFEANIPTNPRVSHISDNGIVYFQVDERSLCYINEAIDTLSDDIQQLTRFNMTSADVVLVHDASERRFFRAKITDVLPANRQWFTCLYIDYGYIRSVPASRIYDLKIASLALYSYPEQAIPARLKALTNFDDFIPDRLRSILSDKSKIIAKPVKCVGHIATVEVFKREYPSGHMVCINDWIRMEAELRK